VAALYLADALDPAVVPGDRVELAGDEARHALTVARVRVGEQIAIGDGVGTIVAGPVVVADARTLAIEVDRVRRDEPAVPEIWLAQALAKGDRDELAVQAATELGVSGVIPWAAERSVSRWDGGKAERGRERWAAIVREATKQSIRSRVPLVEPLASTAELCALRGTLLVLHPDASTALTATAATATALDADRLVLVVGPEGGISSRELAAFDEAGAVRVRLGPEVLRTSTAGPAALAVLNASLGRW
jgi:16S rRNA (uracil1498-N3)-methyltransferase